MSDGFYVSEEVWGELTGGEDGQFWKGVREQLEYSGRLFTDEERASWADPEKAADSIVGLKTGEYIDREMELIQEEGEKDG